MRTIFLLAAFLLLSGADAPGGEAAATPKPVVAGNGADYAVPLPDGCLYDERMPGILDVARFPLAGVFGQTQTMLSGDANTFYFFSVALRPEKAVPEADAATPFAAMRNATAAFWESPEFSNPERNGASQFLGLFPDADIAFAGGRMLESGDGEFATLLRYRLDARVRAFDVSEVALSFLHDGIPFRMGAMDFAGRDPEEILVFLKNWRETFVARNRAGETAPE